MRNKLYWGLAILIILIIGVTVVMLSRTTDTEPRKVYIDVDPPNADKPSVKDLVETDKFVKWFEQNKDTLVSNHTEQVKSDMPDEQASDKTPDWNLLTPEQQKQIYAQFYTQFGLKVPPSGYHYHWKKPGVPYLDENGNPVLHRLDEPIVKVNMGIGFAPTLEELEKYKELMFNKGVAKSRGDSDEANKIQAEMDALEASAQRIRPLTVSSNTQTSEAQSKARSSRSKKMREALREHGLEHLISYELWDK